MKFILPILLMLLSMAVSAQKAKLSSTYKAGDNKLCTYQLMGFQSSQNGSDELPSVSSNTVVQDLYRQLSQINGVSEVIFDAATHTISVTASMVASLPEELYYKQAKNPISPTD